MKLWPLLFAFLVLLGIGCKKNNGEFEPTDRKRSYLHIMSGAAAADSFDVTIDYYNADNIVIGNFHNLRDWPMTGYANLEEGGKPDDFGHGKMYLTATKPGVFAGEPADTIMMPREMILEPEVNATICFTDSAGQLTFFKISDAFTSPTSGHAMIRLVNANESVATATLKSQNGTISVGGTGFMGDTQFAEFPEGQYNLQVLNGGGSAVGSIANFWVGGGQILTFYLASDGSIGHYRH